MGAGAPAAVWGSWEFAVGELITLAIKKSLSAARSDATKFLIMASHQDNYQYFPPLLGLVVAW